MELTKDTIQGKYQITGYEPGIVYVNQQAYKHSLMIMPDIIITDWQVDSISKLSKDHIEQILSYHPQVVLLGTGEKLIFPNSILLTPLYKQDIGVEVMNTPAVCRTYSLLMAEGRKVLAGIIIA